MSDVVATVKTVDALLTAYQSGERNFVNVMLPQSGLSGVDLKGADLSYADFSGADLSQANLRGSDLSYATLCEANLTGADLRGAMLLGTDLRESVLDKALLQSADYDPEETHFPSGFDPEAAEMKCDR
ncbi:MAG: pentapeptide repeat-containing protein [Cyanobacteria bacterium P01_A01_bin.116]